MAKQLRQQDAEIDSDKGRKDGEFLALFVDFGLMSVWVYDNTAIPDGWIRGRLQNEKQPLGGAYRQGAAVLKRYLALHRLGKRWGVKVKS